MPFKRMREKNWEAGYVSRNALNKMILKKGHLGNRAQRTLWSYIVPFRYLI